MLLATLMGLCEMGALGVEEDDMDICNWRPGLAGEGCATLD